MYFSCLQYTRRIDTSFDDLAIIEWNKQLIKETLQER